MIRGIQKVTGTRSQPAADRLFAEAASALGLTLEKGSNCITTRAMLVELAPQNSIERCFLFKCLRHMKRPSYSCEGPSSTVKPSRAQMQTRLEA